MVRRVRWWATVLIGGVLAGALAVTGPAVADPTNPVSRPGPTAGVQISGDGMAEPLRLRSPEQRPQVLAVIDQVDWIGRVGRAKAPAKADLGRKFTVVVYAGDKATRTFDLYPYAKGGPRIFRPAKQPGTRAVNAGWFLGRLNMSETLRSVGVPVERTFDTISGGVGGGERVIPEDALNPAGEIDDALGELRRLLLLNVSVVLVITVGIAGIAWLIRRRTR
ncbi:hypothetical protein K7640_18630 [Micromonospora sp. PLK6-60]|uniref:hypothetical protein n=1 Tax=Micromonospora sp. PLK6-60 TaxID=2873383 RepID=UPI001CA6BD2E|nr:hypothetical protein [Micromonospora sp. PLK6-60]MBY8873849.1 hypothetical protein [Micromonospora sp. PLK6-60]